MSRSFRNIPARSLAGISCLWLLVALVSGCANKAVDNEAPVETVRQFIAALEDRDVSAMIDLLEPTDWRKEIGPELRSYLGYVKTLELRDEQYTVERNDGQKATVRLTGTLSYALADDASGERPIDLAIDLVEVDGQWYMHSLELPQPGA